MYCKKSQQNLGTKFPQSIEDAIVRCCLIFSVTVAHATSWIFRAAGKRRYFFDAMDCVFVHDPSDKHPLIHSKEEKDMKKIINQVCTKLAKCAFHAAEVSTGTASCAGLYQPKIPTSLHKK